VRKRSLDVRTCQQAARTAGIVWIIDDDADGSALKGGDEDSDCYVVDYDADGSVDRLVDHIDNNGDNRRDELDLRYFDNGRLNWSWFGDDLDGDTAIRKITGYERGDEFQADPYGDGVFYMNKLDPRTSLVAISSVLRLSDTTGRVKRAVRGSAPPRSYDVSATRTTPTSLLRPWVAPMADIGIFQRR